MLPLFFYTLAFETFNERIVYDMDYGAFVAGVIAIGGIIGIYVKMQVSLKQIEIRQENQSGRIDILEDLVKAQIQMDRDMRTSIQELTVQQATMIEQIKTVIKRIDKNHIDE